MKKILSILLLVGACFSLPTVIDGPYDYSGSNHYLLSVSNWTDAQLVASIMGGNLVTVRSEEHNAWLWETFSDTPYRYLWLAYTDQSVEGQWVWIADSTNTYTNWHPSQPDDYGTGQDYAYIGYNHSPVWDDENDTPFQGADRTHGIVEIPLVSISTTTWGTIKSSF